MKKLLSRKFILTAVMAAASIAALFTGHLSGSAWIGTVGVILGAHAAGNAASKFARRGNK